MAALESLRILAGILFWALMDVLLVMAWAGVILFLIGGVLKWLMK